jgi:hypothetical protein
MIWPEKMEGTHCRVAAKQPHDLLSCGIEGLHVAKLEVLVKFSEVIVIENFSSQLQYLRVIMFLLCWRVPYRLSPSLRLLFVLPDGILGHNIYEGVCVK